MKRKIAVIGATGLVGKAVAEKLNDEGFSLIVLTRNRKKARQMFNDSFEVLEADVLDPESIRHSFTGVDGIFISIPEQIVPIAMPLILAAAQHSNVKHIVYASGCTVKKENAWHPMIKGHFEGEAAIVKSGIPYTIFKLTMIMDMIPRYANNGKPFIIGKQPHAWSWISTADIASMAAAAFFKEEVFNKKLTIWGPEKCTIPDAVSRYMLNRGLGSKAVKPRPYWIAHLLALFVGTKLKYAISIFKYFEDHPEEGDPRQAWTLLGKPQMDLESFFSLHAQQ